jgi:hypothetical protein
MITTKIDDYEVMYSSNAFAPRIWLRSGGKFIGQLIFEHNGSALPPDNLVNGQVNLYYHLEDYENALDLLRNIHDTPVYLLYVGSGWGNENGLVTSVELAGGG